jgi:hypothetical protein
VIVGMPEHAVTLQAFLSYMTMKRPTAATAIAGLFRLL